MTSVCLKELGHHINPKCTIYHNSGHCTHNPVNWQYSKEIASLYGKNKMAVLLIALRSDPVPLIELADALAVH